MTAFMAYYITCYVVNNAAFNRIKLFCVIKLTLHSVKVCLAKLANTICYSNLR